MVRVLTLLPCSAHMVFGVLARAHHPFFGDVVCFLCSCCSGGGGGGGRGGTLLS